MIIEWTAAMRGIAEWVADACQLPNDSVKWIGQGGQWPPVPWVALSSDEIRGVGEDAATRAVNPLVIPDVAIVSVDAAANTLRINAHGLITGDGPVRFTTTGTLPAGLALATDYWIVVVDVDHVALVASRAAALVAVPVPIDITSIGSGTHTLADTADTRRVGQEIVNKIEGQRRMSLTLKCFADEAFGPERAQGILERLRARRSLPSMLQRMRELGIGIASVGPSMMVGGSLSTASSEDPGATMELVLHYIDGATEVGTNIASVRVAGTVRSSSGDVVDSVVMTVAPD